MCNSKFFICKRCGNLIGMIHNSGVPIVCCGENMVELIANTEEASYEKHLPQVEVDSLNVKVTVGSVLHPMVKEHYIDWIYLQTANGGQRKCLKIGSEPTVEFSITNDTPVAVYAYCNLHGLWVTNI